MMASPLWLTLCLVIVAPLVVMCLVSPTVRGEVKTYFDLSHIRRKMERNKEQDELFKKLNENPELLAEVKTRLNEAGNDNGDGA